MGDYEVEKFQEKQDMTIWECGLEDNIWVVDMYEK